MGDLLSRCPSWTQQQHVFLCIVLTTRWCFFTDYKLLGIGFGAFNEVVEHMYKESYNGELKIQFSGDLLKLLISTLRSVCIKRTLEKTTIIKSIQQTVLLMMSMRLFDWSSN